MTATFNSELLEILQKMTGIQINNENIFWSDGASFDKRNIRIDFDLCFNRNVTFRDKLKETLGNDQTSKAIIYSSVAKTTEVIQDDVDDYLDGTDEVFGDTVVINGDLEQEWKCVTARKFTEKITDMEQRIELNRPVPRILIATAGCIGAGLDCNDVKAVATDSEQNCSLQTSCW